jgi:hypothetical protein
MTNGNLRYRYPIEELEALRGAAVFTGTNVAVKAGTPLPLKLGSGVTKMSEVVATFSLPAAAANFGITIGVSRPA